MSRLSDHTARRGCAVVLAVMTLSACQTDALVVDADDPCGASALQGYIGQPETEVPRPADTPVRVISPGMAVTMDYLEKRLNIHVDEVGVVTALRCG